MREITYADAISEAMKEEMHRDPRVFTFGVQIALMEGLTKAYRGLHKEFGDERVLDMPISEEAYVGMAVGAAISGMRPVVEIMYIDFATLCMQEIVNNAAKSRYRTNGQLSVPLVIRTQGGAGIGRGMNHSQSLEAWFTHVPGLKVVMPATPYDVKGLLKSAIRDPDPVVFIENKELYRLKGPVPEEEYLIPLGEAVVKRRGKDLTIVAYSFMVPLVLEAADILAEDGIDVEVVDPRTLVPLDEATIFHSVKKTGRAIVVHESCQRGGYGAEIGMRITEEVFDWLDGPVKRVAGKDLPIPYSPAIGTKVIPRVEDIVNAAREF
ncbi:MAG: alpha-ketoacid dehydrogenase subunit beta [Anaerolineales bacterium]|nr:alpha-ketoacid dehydrogenase subunit beta [Anaerolineales bacterium]